MSVSAILLAGLLSSGGVGIPTEMVLGEETGYSETLLGDMSDTLYGLQLTPRGGRVCHVRAFFRGAPPQTANFCSGRVTARHMRRASAAVLGVGERVQSIGACRDRNGMIAEIRLHTDTGDEVLAQVADCVGEYTQVSCMDQWSIQGVQLFFDGDENGRSHRRLRGVRALCSIMHDDRH